MNESKLFMVKIVGKHDYITRHFILHTNQLLIHKYQMLLIQQTSILWKALWKAKKAMYFHLSPKVGFKSHLYDIVPSKFILKDDAQSGFDGD